MKDNELSDESCYLRLPGKLLHKNDQGQIYDWLALHSNKVRGGMKDTVGEDREGFSGKNWGCEIKEQIKKIKR